MKKFFNRESFIMTLVVLCYSILAGGSLSGSIGQVLILIGCSFVVMIIVVGVQSIIKSNNKTKRMKLISEYENKKSGSILSDKIGDDRCVVYFDKDQKSALIASVTTDGVIDYKVSGFVKDIAAFSSGDFCAIDVTQRKALLINDDAKNGNFKVVQYSEMDFNHEFLKSNTLVPILEVFRIPVDVNVFKTLFVLVEEMYGFITVFDKNNIDSFSYIAKSSLTLKKKSDVTIKAIGVYVFVMDDYYKKLIIISPGNNKNFINYNDVISVSYEEDGNTLFSKSTGRTVGGALVGGALLGGAGAVVGGLSGNSSQNKIVEQMSVKILLRSTKKPTIVLKVNLKNKIFNTKNETDKLEYNKCLNWANQIKDLFSVLIDNSVQSANNKYYKAKDSNDVIESKNEMSIADELSKLVKLKETGVINDEEFNTLKSKLLGV